MQPTSSISATGPAAFGVFAERFRRAGQPEKAVTLCREGLEQFPDHLSARVTLGWSLLDMGEFEEASEQLKSVNKRAPDNLAAIRGLAELHERGIGLVFESMPDAEVELDPEIAPLTNFDPVMPAFEAAPAPGLPQVSNQLEDHDPIFEPEAPVTFTVGAADEMAVGEAGDLTVDEDGYDAPPSAAPHFAIEDVIQAGEPDSMFDLSGLLEGVHEPAHQSDQPLQLAHQSTMTRTPISTLDREPLALRDDTGDERAGELHEWLSRVRERRFNSVSQLMAG
jgi:hypothetical protein